MALTDDPAHRRASRRQTYEDFCKYAKAPALRRTAAAFIDLSFLGVPAAYGFLWTGSYLVAVPLVLYLFVRDCLFHGRSVGKAMSGLVVVHKATFAPCTLRQSLIRNSLYAALCPVLLMAGVAAFGIGAAFLSAGLLIFVLTRNRFNLLFFIGYDPDDGRTIPDSWAETHVLMPREIAMIIKLRDEIDAAA